MSARKLWKVQFHTWSDDTETYRPESKAAAYRFVEAEVGNYQGGSRRIKNGRMWVLVDERDGQGWQLYESIYLGELAYPGGAS